MAVHSGVPVCLEHAVAYGRQGPAKVRGVRARWRNTIQVGVDAPLHDVFSDHDRQRYKYKRGGDGGSMYVG